MTITVSLGDPHHPEATQLLTQSHALMQDLFPPEDNFYLEIDDLCAADIAFFVAKDGTQIIGTGALADKGGYGELKSMFVAPQARGKGVANALIHHIEMAARDKGFTALKLETGNVLHAAQRLYKRAGFVNCGPFGDYPNALSSVFMEKPL